MLIPVFLVGLVPGPAMLGLWESLTFYHTFGALDAPLSFLIAPRANIGGQGYPFLEMARPIIRLLHLPLTLATFRISAVLFGAVSLLLFFIIARRYFGAWAALGATALLAANQVFVQAAHMVNVLIVSGAALLFVIERLQALELRYWSWRTWGGLAVAVAVVSLLYGPARIFTVILVGLWLIRSHRLIRGPDGAEVRRGVRVLAAYGAVASALLLFALDRRNIISVLRFRTFLFPTNSEVVGLSEQAQGAGLVATIWMNLKIVLDSIIGRIGSFHSPFATYFIGDLRFPLISKMVVPFVLVGAMVSFGWWRRRTALLATPWANILVMLVVFAVPVLMSHVLFKPGEVIGTLSTYRMFFLLIPLHLLVAAALARVGAERTRPILGYLAAAFVAVVFAALVRENVVEHGRFERQVYAAEWRRHGAVAGSYWNDRAPELDRQDSSYFSHFQQHAQYANAARMLTKQLAGGTAGRRLIFVDANLFTEAPLFPQALHYIENRNYHSVFLALYAGNEGLDVNPVVMLDSARAPEILGGTGYNGRPRRWSALTEISPSGALGYQRSAKLYPAVLQITGRSSYDLLVTTPEEETAARQMLNASHTSYQYVRLAPERPMPDANR